jgi:2-oxoglutarate ferredoxin oxidoreductase subunit alpha
MLFASQGEFPRLILTPGSVEECFSLGWQAFNLAEKYQTPVMVLSDQNLADGYRTVNKADIDFDAITLDRGMLLTDADLDALDEPYLRYKDTPSGISPRAVPGHPNAVWVTSSNEHAEDGAIDESPEVRVMQVNKRTRKMTGASDAVPGPTLYGPADAELSFVCWGSTYGPVREAVDRLEGQANMIHFRAIEPFPSGAQKMLEAAHKLVAVEGNATGQLVNLIRMRTGIHIDRLITKYDGRPYRAPIILEKLKEVA